MFDTPILFLIFNRIETTRKVFEKIREVKPKQLFVAADGPRQNRPEESEICDLVRAIATAIDWDCELKTLFRKENLGCGKAVSEAISWFFSEIEEGIILEDDCLPDISFFSYCAELLDRYRDDARIFSITGCNLLNAAWKKDLHSYFWSFPHIWGWATWRKAWEHYDFKMQRWEDPEIRLRIKDALRMKGWIDFYYPMLEATYKGELDTWDIQWFFMVLLNGGMAANPSINLIKNIGFGEDATHTSNFESPIARLEINKLDFPLKHPTHFIFDVDYLDKVLVHIIPVKKHRTRFTRIISILRNMFHFYC